MLKRNCMTKCFKRMFITKTATIITTKTVDGDKNQHSNASNDRNELCVEPVCNSSNFEWIEFIMDASDADSDFKFRNSFIRHLKSIR